MERPCPVLGTHERWVKPFKSPRPDGGRGEWVGLLPPKVARPVAKLTRGERRTLHGSAYVRRALSGLLHSSSLMLDESSVLSH